MHGSAADRRTLARQGRSVLRSRNNAKAKLVALAFDRNGDLDAHLSAQRLDIVVDASGPFQGYGEGRYRLIEACISVARTISTSPTAQISWRAFATSTRRRARRRSSCCPGSPAFRC